jgi:hypothetical protein
VSNASGLKESLLPMCSAELPRVYELVASLKDAPRSYFKNFVTSIRDNPLKRKHFIDIEAELARLDAVAWDHLRTKVGPLFMKKEKARGWQGAFSELNEAKAYNFLIRRGCTSVEFIPRRSDSKTPDLRAKLGSVDVLCEAKTINRSEREVVARTRNGVSSVANRLPTEFFTKLTSTIRRADQQMAASSSAPDIKRIVYLVINFDDSLHEYVDDYLAQIQQRKEEFVVPGLEIVLDVKPKFYSASLASATSLALNFMPAAPWLPPSSD